MKINLVLNCPKAGIKESSVDHVAHSSHKVVGQGLVHELPRLLGHLSFGFFSWVFLGKQFHFCTHLLELTIDLIELSVDVIWQTDECLHHCFFIDVLKSLLKGVLYRLFYSFKLLHLKRVHLASVVFLSSKCTLFFYMPTAIGLASPFPVAKWALEQRLVPVFVKPLYLLVCWLFALDGIIPISMTFFLDTLTFLSRQRNPPLFVRVEL